MEFINKGFELELFALHELPMVFNYAKYVYQMLLYNRRPMIFNFCEDQIKSGLINFEDLDKSG